MTYTPARDHRFEYITDVIEFIEENQCKVCYFRKDPNTDWEGVVDAPMCYEIEGAIITEEPVEQLEDRDAAGVICTKFHLGDPPPVPDPGQMDLFDTET